MKHPVDTSQWGEFVVGELFDKIYSVRQVKSQRNIVDELKGIPFVVQTQTNNMVKCYASKNTFDEHNVPIIKGNSIAMGVDLAVISYQEKDYGGSHIIVAESDKLNPLRGKFIVAIMTAKLGPKYNYVNKPGVQKYKQDVIPLPLKPSANLSNYTQDDIDWDYMDTVMSRVTARAKDRLVNLPQPTDKKKTSIDTSTWGEFVVGELFETNGNKTYTGAGIPKNNLESGSTPRITVTDKNNGIIGYFDDTDNVNYRVYENFISVSFLGTVFWHPYKASVDMKVHVLNKLKRAELNEKRALFLVACIKKTIATFSYAEQLSASKLYDLSIKLPLKPSADPSNYSQEDIDWDYMDRFMQAIEEKAHERVASLKERMNEDD